MRAKLIGANTNTNNVLDDFVTYVLFKNGDYTDFASRENWAESAMLFLRLSTSYFSYDEAVNLSANDLRMLCTQYAIYQQSSDGQKRVTWYSNKKECLKDWKQLKRKLEYCGDCEQSPCKCAS